MPSQPGQLRIKSQTIYHCNWLLKIGWQTALRCTEVVKAERLDSDACETSTDEAISCILLAAASAEAFINELGWALREPPSSKSGAGWFLKQLEDEHAKTMLKFAATLLFLTGKPPDLGGAPLQDLATLFALRNELMHAKKHSTILHVEDDTAGLSKKLLKDLSVRGLTRKMQRGARTHMIGHLMTHRVAEWACRTASDACKFVASLVPDPKISKLFNDLMTLTADPKKMKLISYAVELPPNKKSG